MIFSNSQVSLNRRVERAYGWPQDVYVRLNWVEGFTNDKIIFDEVLRPRESSVSYSSAVVNTLVLIAMVGGLYLVMIAMIDRVFNLRNLMLVILCIAILVAFLPPALERDLAQWQELRRQEQWNAVWDGWESIAPKR